MIQGLLSLYSPKYPSIVIYMLQSTEYRVLPYLRWYWQTTNFSAVPNRRQLQFTKPALLLLLAVRIGMLLEILLAGGFIIAQIWHDFTGGWEFGLALLLAYPIVWAHLVVVPLVLGRWLIVRPRERVLIRQSEGIFRTHKAIKIAVAGSYGKTSMKELLLTVLGEGKNVAATPANKNVAISHAYFARGLQGAEDILIIEYGEGAPGDVAGFAATTHPTHAIITGLAPAHLDQYKTLQQAGEDIFAVARAVPKGHAYVNTESLASKSFMQKGFESYSADGVLGWKVSDIRVRLDGVRFTMKRKKTTLHLRSGLIGRHQVGPLALAVALAFEFGLTPEQIEQGIAKTQPFEHRMQPYALAGAWIIDDTYNGNIEGVRAGTQLLLDLPGKRKVYITPGLVDQGDQTESIHKELGQLVATAQPDIVVLMQNSVANFIQAGLQAGGYKGQVIVESDPLGFYTNLPAFVAAHDLVVMQNDWPDNYS